MAKITRTYEIPDGNYCSVVTHQEGHLTDNVHHCRFRTSLHIKDGERVVECCAFNKKLKLADSNDGYNWRPIKCEECPKK
jgi:hypothetical protein